ncbi:oligosaccharide flippase family protein [Mesorhizobium sp. B2-1-8]|uniref:oligosaccharide flippase family protein n=1 Tax=Mesorhizobium sp. B2-1-8 TaxID=2589967 RepID=UPI001D113FBC|nr:oligosaccharide flippase family protein [Mesorhizobium sp. B2-1-8]UCI22446.1 oligosaccharide flippase family protein [Mesorhizobium sp. B2-1-8]
MEAYRQIGFDPHMIIEIFGPPGSGKTTFAHALARRLRHSGYRANVTLSYRPSEAAGNSYFLGARLFVFRVLAAMVSTARILASSKGRKEDLATASSMVRLIPPGNRFWRARLWQYILHLSRSWRQARQAPDIVIFDQGYVQAVGSLAMFNGAADSTLLAKVLSLTPPADLTIRIAMPYEVVETRLRQRITRELPAERVFEADPEINMRSFGVFQAIDSILLASGRKVVSVDTLNDQATAEGFRRVEQEILSAIPRTDSIAAVAGPKKEAPDLAASSLARDAHATSASAVVAGSQHPRSNAADRVKAVLLPKQDVGWHLAQASLFALLIYIAGAGLTSVAQLLIARLIGPRNYGIYSYVLAWTSVLAYLATLGFNVSLLRFVPAYRANGRLDLAKGVIAFALRWSLTTATLLGLLGATLIFFYSDHSQKGLVVSNFLGMAAVPLITAYALGATLVRAHGGVVSALLPERIVRDGLLVILVGIAAKSGLRAVDAPLVMLTVVMSSVMTVALVFLTAARIQPPGLRLAHASYAAKEWWSSVPPLTLITGLDVFVSRAGVMVLGWTDHIREAGVFALALNVALLVGLSRIAVGTMFSPTAADLFARRDRQGLQQLFARATLLSLGGAIVVAIPLLVIVKPLLGFFGEGFVAGAPIARVLIFGYFFVALCGPQQNLLTMTGNEWAAASTMIAGATANVIACAVGVAIYGPIGAAVGVAVALAVWNTAMAIYISKRLKILPGLVFALTSLKPDGLGKLVRYRFLR